jgi:hypothetical protein
MAKLIEVPGQSEAETIIIDLDQVCTVRVIYEGSGDPSGLHVSIAFGIGGAIELAGASAKSFLDSYRQSANPPLSPPPSSAPPEESLPAD